MPWSRGRGRESDPCAVMAASVQRPPTGHAVGRYDVYVIGLGGMHRARAGDAGSGEAPQPLRGTPRGRASPSSGWNGSTSVAIAVAPLPITAGSTGTATTRS